jgi:hypothetical protein
MENNDYWIIWFCVWYAIVVLWQVVKLIILSIKIWKLKKQLKGKT